MINVDRKAFLDHLRDLGDAPCGTRSQCPLTVFLGSGLDSLHLFSSLPPRSWAKEFATWADTQPEYARYHWARLPAKRALAYLTKSAAALLLALSFSLPAHAWPHSSGGSKGWKPRSASVHAPRPHAPRPHVPKPSRPRHPR